MSALFLRPMDAILLNAVNYLTRMPGTLKLTCEMVKRLKFIPGMGLTTLKIRMLCKSISR